MDPARQSYRFGWKPQLGDEVRKQLLEMSKETMSEEPAGRNVQKEIC
jgi:hypothetical protein